MSVPIVTGASGLTGRPRVRPLEPHEYEEEPEVAARPALPAPCLHRLHTFRDEGCQQDCPGRQRDDSCLCDVVRASGGAVTFEIDAEGYWTEV